jgi:hypothetical protein
MPPGAHCSAMVCGKQVSDPEFLSCLVVVVFLLMSGSCKLFQWWGPESRSDWEVDRSYKRGGEQQKAYPLWGPGEGPG